MNGTITAYYVYGLGLISKVMPDGTAYYYHYDSCESTIALTDAGQNITDAYAYDSFGNVVNRFGVNANPFRYVGRYGVQDEGNGLQYIRARYYIPELGRFITKDPLTGKDGDSQSLNRYVYAVNNPVRLVDVSGLSPKEEIRKSNLIDKFFNSIDTEVSAAACVLLCLEQKIVVTDKGLFEVSARGIGLAAEAKIIEVATLLNNTDSLQEGEFILLKSSGGIQVGAGASGSMEWLKCKAGGGWGSCNFLNLKATYGPFRGEKGIDSDAKGGLRLGLGGGIHALSLYKVRVKRLL